jgi:hypothetical protein
MLTGKMPWADMPMQQIMMAVAVQFRVPTVPEGAPACVVLLTCSAAAWQSCHAIAQPLSS